MNMLNPAYLAPRSKPSQKAKMRLYLEDPYGPYRTIEGKPQPAWRYMSLYSRISWLIEVGVVRDLAHYYPGLTESGSQTVFLANSSYYGTTSVLGFGTIPFVDTAMKGNTYNALFDADTRKPWSIPQYTCTSGNCAWDPVVSLEVRALCSNIANRLRLDCAPISDKEKTLNCTCTLPNSTLATWFRNDSHRDEQPMVVGPVTAVTIRNEYHDETLATRARSKYPDGTPLYLFKPPWGMELGMRPNQSFSIGQWPTQAMQRFLSNLFKGRFQRKGGKAFPLSYADYDDVFATLDAMHALMARNITGCGYDASDKLRCTMENVAAAMSKSLRDLAYVLSDSDPQRANMTRGRAMGSITYVSVRWQ
ncbi:hypothetical protein BBP40_008763 [Aspergillus hancockii]|nr:hypothetical protein BBP40_008763 [Aspergillus hancockii]